MSARRTAYHRLLVAAPTLLVLITATLGAAGPTTGDEAEDGLVGFFDRLRQGTPQTVVAYGTSLTYGGEWARAMRAWFDERYPGLVTVVNSGGPGRNSDWGVEQLDARVLAHRPDLVFIEFSYNDAHRKFEMPVERGAANLDAIVRGIRSANARAAVILQTMTAPWDATTDNPPASSRPELQAFNDNYRRYAAERGLPLLDHDRAWQRLRAEDRARYEAYAPDGSHPTAEGSLAVTWPAVRDLLAAEAGAAGP